jgi:hypothetical protein
MEWQKRRDGYLGKTIVDIKTLRVLDSSDRVRRFRVCTVFKNFESFSSMPAQARLFKSENGFIGVLVTGKNEGYVKVGKSFLLLQVIKTGLNSLSKKALKELLKKRNIELTDIDGTTVGLEK